MKKSRKNFKPTIKVRDLKAKKQAKGGGTVNFSDIKIVKTVDKSSPTLLK